MAQPPPYNPNYQPSGVYPPPSQPGNYPPQQNPYPPQQGNLFVARERLSLFQRLIVIHGFLKWNSYLNPFHTTDLFLYHLKTSENQSFSDVFRGYKKRSVAWNGFTSHFLHQGIEQNVTTHLSNDSLYFHFMTGVILRLSSTCPVYLLYTHVKYLCIFWVNRKSLNLRILSTEMWRLECYEIQPSPNKPGQTCP